MEKKNRIRTGLVIKTRSTSNSNDWVKSKVNFVDKNGFSAKDLEGEFKGKIFGFSFKYQDRWDLLPQEYPDKCYEEDGTLKTPESGYRWLKVGETPSQEDFAVVGSQKYKLVDAGRPIEIEDPAFLRKLEKLPRWIQGSEIVPGMTIVGNIGRDGYSEPYIYTYQVTKVGPRHYDTGSDKIFYFYFDGINLGKDNVGRSQENSVFWSHRQYLLIAQE